MAVLGQTCSGNPQVLQLSFLLPILPATSEIVLKYTLVVVY